MQPQSLAAQAAAGDAAATPRSSQLHVPGTAARGSNDLHAPSPQQTRTREQVLRSVWGASGEPSAPVKRRPSRGDAWADLEADLPQPMDCAGVTHQLPVTPRQLFKDM
mmetsp:Transcript_59205/g.152313  ORF Transcript_59205/g.152313 Transcript_59205/m.152313 type:complete len:108 (-) Transcript_59205:156-479(-)